MFILREYKIFVYRIGILGITNILTVLAVFILLPVLTKNLSPDNYGIYVQIMVTVALIPNITSLGLPYTMVRFFASSHKKTEIQEGFYSILFIVILTSGISALLFFIFSKSIAALLFNNNLEVVFFSIYIIFFASLNVFLLNYFRTFQQIKLYSVYSLIQTYLNVFITVYFVIILNMGILGAILGLLITQIISLLIMYLTIFLQIGFKFPEFKNLRKYLYFGIPTIPSNLSSWTVSSIDRYLVGIMLGNAFVAYYSPGYSLANIILIFLTPFTILLTPALSKYYDEKKIAKVKILLEYSQKYFLLLAIPSVFGLSILSKSILLVLTTPEIALNGYLVTPIVSLSALIIGIGNIFRQIIILNKNTKIIGYIMMGAAILNIILNIVFIPILGILGAASTTLIAYIFSFILTMFYTSKYIKFNYNVTFIFKSIFASSFMSIPLIIFNPEGPFKIFLLISLAALIYISVLFLIKGIKKEEINFFKELVSIRSDSNS